LYNFQKGKAKFNGKINKEMSLTRILRIVPIIQHPNVKKMLLFITLANHPKQLHNLFAMHLSYLSLNVLTGDFINKL